MTASWPHPYSLPNPAGCKALIFISLWVEKMGDVAKDLRIENFSYVSITFCDKFLSS